MHKNRIRILNAVRLMLRPIARVMLRNNIDFRQFTEAAKLAFIDVGTSDFGIRGRPTNISRLAVMNCLTRKEIRRVRNLLEGDDMFSQIKPSISEKVISGWQSDEDFLTAGGKPRALPYDTGKNPFQELARRYAPDVPDGAVRTEMLRTGAMETTRTGKYKLIGNPEPSAEQASQLDDLLGLLMMAAETVEHNSQAAKADQWPTEKIITTEVHPGNEKKFRRLSNKKFAKLQSDFESIAETYEALLDKGKPENGITPSVALFYFETGSTKN